MLPAVLRSVEILAGVGLVFAAFIALAYWKLRVWEDPRIDVVTSMLPGANCGACGFPGCRNFAEQAVAGAVKPASCNVINEEGAALIASYLGVDAGQASKRVARLLCAGGTNVAVKQAEYRGLSTCGAASAVAGGGKGCAWGCLGFGDCGVACKFDAITMNKLGLPVVDVVKCTACGDCVSACPKNLFEIIPLDQKLLVTLLFAGRQGAEAELVFTPRNGGDETLITTRIHGERSVLRTALAGTSRARLAYAPDWMLNLSFRPVLRQLAGQIEAGDEADLGLTQGEMQARWESNLSEEERRQVADWRQYDATRPAVDPVADAKRPASGGAN